MKQIDFSTKFNKQYSKLQFQIQKKFDNQIKFFLKDFRHPSLRIKKMNGHRNIWKLSITMEFRATFEVFDQKIVFRKIGNHSILKNP